MNRALYRQLWASTAHAAPCGSTLQPLRRTALQLARPACALPDGRLGDVADNDEAVKRTLTIEDIKRVLLYGDLSTATYDNYIGSEKPVSNKPRSATAPVQTFGLLPGTSYGQPRFWISEAAAHQYGGLPGLPELLKACDTGADRFRGLQDIYAYNGWDNLRAPRTLREEPSAAWQGFAAYADPQGKDGHGELVFAFRGSILHDEWLSNLLGALVKTDFKKGDATFGRVHHGFMQMYAATKRSGHGGSDPLAPPKDVVEKVLDQLSQAGKKFRVTCIGHSLGGALATLCALHVADYLADGRRVSCYTFNAPRVGNEKFAGKFSNLGVQVCRIVNKHDITPHVPPRLREESAALIAAIPDSTSADLQLVKAALLQLDEQANDASSDHTLVDAAMEPSDVHAKALDLRLDWKHPGLRVEVDPYNKPGAVDLSRLKSRAQHHNLDLCIHLVAQLPDPAVYRDPALLNKSDDLLKQPGNVPANWWNPEPKPGQERHNAVKLVYTKPA